MNNEIKEHILERLNDSIYYKFPLTSGEERVLLDLITNLQEENEKLNLELSGYREAILRDDKLLGLKDYKSRCEKAIEYIKTCNPDVDLNSMFLNENYISNYGANDLLKILNGGDEE